MKHLRKNKLAIIYTSALFLLLISAITGILFGATEFNFSDFINVLFGNNKNSVESRILWYVRFPRVMASLVCGAALAVSGAVIQSVLANKLASPSIIGINSGAGFAVTLCSAIGIVGGWKLSFFAFIGAFFAALPVSIISSKQNSSPGTIILFGVALNSLFGAMSYTVTTFVPEVGIMSNDFKIGDFSAVTYTKLIPTVIIVIISLVILITFSNALDVLTLGDENAKGLGLNTGIMRMIFLILTAFLAGSAVSVAGLLSFVGLLVPHAVRRIATSQSCHLLPLCAMFGAGFVTICDTISRIAFSPYELPVGIIMSFLGVPFFIFILIKRKEEYTHA